MEVCHHEFESFKIKNTCISKQHPLLENNNNMTKMTIKESLLINVSHSTKSLWLLKNIDVAFKVLEFGVCLV